jgi:hypothetical protein
LSIIFKTLLSSYPIMDKKQFSSRFNDAIDLTIAHTRNFCFNELIPKYEFIVSPNTSKTAVVLDDDEVAHIKTLKELHHKPQSFDEVLDLIQIGDRNPLWINISVYEAGQDITLIELLCARRLRKVETIPNNVDKYPPFHVWTAMPPEEFKVKINNKFDVNWRSIADKNKGFFDKVKSYFVGD